MKMSLFALLGATLVVSITSCSKPEQAKESPLRGSMSADSPVVARDLLKNAYFGDLHIHTRYSFDAYLMGTRASPDDAYRFGKGEMISHSSGFQMKMKKPLDFLAVTDHASIWGNS